MTEEQEKQIGTQVQGVVSDAITSGRTIEAAWLVQAVISTWEKPDGHDADKWMTCGYAHVRNIVRQVVRRYRPDELDTESARQLVLPGHEKLHCAYLIPRDGAQVIVPVNQLTVAEAFGIVDELTRCETGLRIHRNEMLRYIDEVLIPAQTATA